MSYTTPDRVLARFGTRMSLDLPNFATQATVPYPEVEEFIASAAARMNLVLKRIYKFPLNLCDCDTVVVLQMINELGACADLAASRLIGTEFSKKEASEANTQEYYGIMFSKRLRDLKEGVIELAGECPLDGNSIHNFLSSGQRHPLDPVSKFKRDCCPTHWRPYK